MGNWVRQAREKAEGTPALEERAEIRELERELERIKCERDILGKSSGPLSAISFSCVNRDRFDAQAHV